MSKNELNGFQIAALKEQIAALKWRDLNKM